jgi:glucose/arabinose dehydrogenase
MPGQPKFSVLVSVALSVATLSGSLVTMTAASPLLQHEAALGDFKTDAPGVRRLIKVEDLPKPGATKSVDRGPHIVPRPEGALPKVPPGFEVDLWATGLSNPRRIATAPNGDIFIAESSAGRIKILRPGPDGKVISTNIFAEKLRQPFGIAFYPSGGKPKFVYIGNTDSVVRFAYESGDLNARAGEEMVVPDIPGGGKLRGGGHWTRDLLFVDHDKKLLVSVGSHSNNDDDPNGADKHRANILEYNPDGSGFRIFASGIRNPVSLALEPQTRQVWTSVNERDGLGDDLPPDYITHVEENGFYGWPWYYTGNHHDPKHEGKRPELGSTVIVPDVLVQPHSASLCMTFYDARQFPSAYRGWAFAAEHGSWNRERRTGYKVICVPIKNGNATGEYDDFMTGFVTDSGDVWGRPVGVAIDKQGSLLVSDDAGNCLWRVRYVGVGQ